MKLEAIFEQWAIDAKIDQSNLTKESLEVGLLHHKYYKMFVSERAVERVMESEYDKLIHDKREFYTKGETTETRERGWQFPGKIAKIEVQSWLDADKDLINAKLALAAQSEKVQLLKSIIDRINRRNFDIKNAIDYLRWSNGG